MLCVETKKNKTQIIEHVATESGLSKKQAGAAVNAVFDAIQAQLASGGTVSITALGTFEVRERAARDGVQPGTTEKSRIPPSKAPALKARKTPQDAVKGS